MCIWRFLDESFKVHLTYQIQSRPSFELANIKHARWHAILYSRKPSHWLQLIQIRSDKCAVDALLNDPSGLLLVVLRHQASSDLLAQVNTHCYFMHANLYKISYQN